MFYSLLLVLAIIHFVTCQPMYPTPTKVNPAVTSVNLTQYKGTWFELYADAAVLTSFEKDGYCTTARYGDNMDGTLSVHNFQRKMSPTGPVSEIFGRVYTPDASKPGELVVQFNNMTRLGSYWILGLGPIVSDMYDWAIVSDKYSYTLFVLARDAERFHRLYNSTVVSLTEAMGFKPIATYQGPDCLYSPDMMIPTHNHTMMVSSMAPASNITMPTSEPTEEEEEEEDEEEEEEEYATMAPTPDMTMPTAEPTEEEEEEEEYASMAPVSTVMSIPASSFPQK